MRHFFLGSKQAIKERQGRTVFAGIIALAGVLSAACVWKYGMFAYTGIDLAYFNQVFWNTVHGRPFLQSIHQGLSIGEHAELAILPLSLLYALWQDPRWLLILQAVAVALPAYAVWRIARLRLSAHKDLVAAPMALAAAWLLNGSVHNIALFEFHVLPFAIAPLLMAMLAYEQGQKKRFLLWTFLALLVREDVALVVAMIGVLAWVERRSWWWRAVPAALGAAWFLGAMGLIGRFSAAGGYKYDVYYAWLGRTPLEMLGGIVLHPLRLLLHVVTFANLEMAIGFLMPLMFLPALKPRRLLLLLGPLLQIVLGAPGGGELIIETHYAALFLPALFLAAIDGFASLPPLIQRFRGLFGKDESRRLAYGAVMIGALYGALVLGPLPAAASRALWDEDGRQRAAKAASFVAMVPPDASVAASYAFLPALSSRERLTSLHYVFLGVSQFGEKPFTPPEDLAYVLLDTDDLLAYRAQFPHTAWAAPHYAGGMDRLRAVAPEWSAYELPFVLYPRVYVTPDDLLPPIDQHTIASPPLPFMLNGSAKLEDGQDGAFVRVSAYWQLHGVSPDDLVVKASVHLRDGKVLERTVLLDGAAPASFAYDPDYGEYATFLRIPLPADAPRDGTVYLSLERQRTEYELDGIRTPSRRVVESTPIDLNYLAFSRPRTTEKPAP